MKRITIPLIEHHIYIYRGVAEWQRWLKSSGNKDGSDMPLGKEVGRQCGSDLWIGDNATLPTLIHETSHYIDSLMEHLDTQDSEFRAFITEYVMIRILEYAAKENSNDIPR